MPKLKPVSGIKIIKALGKAGFQVVGRKGSHVRLKRKTIDSVYIVIVPLHPEIKKGTLKSILRQSGQGTSFKSVQRPHVKRKAKTAQH